jgi:Glycosyltransferase 61
MRLRNQSRMMAWEALARGQSQEALEASFVRWESTDQPTSRRIASVNHPRYLCHYCRPVIIEPKYCFVIADPGTLIETSVTNAYVVRDPGLRHLSGFPSPAGYLARRYVRRDWAEVGPVISLATLWPGNYFHFYRDVLPKFLLLEESSVDDSLPIVVPDYLIGQPFFQDAIRSKRLSHWQFISPQGRFLRCEEVVFCSDHQWTMPYLQKRPLLTTSTADDPSATGWTLLDDLDGVLALLDLEASEADTKEERRVFVTRSPARERTLLNFEEVSRVLDDNGFEIIDTEGWSLAEQARLFRQSRYVIALHGAGCVNLIYAAGRNCDLLEIRPPGEEGFESDFGYLCRSLGVGHHQIFGERTSDRVSRSDSFEVNPSALAAAIAGVLAPAERTLE